MIARGCERAKPTAPRRLPAGRKLRHITCLRSAWKVSSLVIRDGTNRKNCGHLGHQATAAGSTAEPESIRLRNCKRAQKTSQLRRIAAVIKHTLVDFQRAPRRLVPRKGVG